MAAVIDSNLVVTSAGSSKTIGAVPTNVLLNKVEMNKIAQVSTTGLRAASTSAHDIEWRHDLRLVHGQDFIRLGRCVGYRRDRRNCDDPGCGPCGDSGRVTDHQLPAHRDNVKG